MSRDGLGVLLLLLLLFKVSISRKDLKLVLKVLRMTGIFHMYACTHTHTNKDTVNEIYEIKNPVLSHFQSSRAVFPLIGCIQHCHAAMSSR